MAASLLLSACGGGDGGDNTPPARNTGSISGNVFDAPVNGAKIDVFEYKDGKVGRKLDSTTSDAFGDYKLEFESSSMPLYVVAQQGSYTDPLTKEIVSSSANKTLRLEGIVNFSEGSDQKLMLTPLTNIVSGLAKYKIANGESGSDAVSEALDSINGMYGFNVNETKPIDITKGGQSSFATPGHQYGALLTAYSSYSYDLIQKYGQSEDKVYTSMHFADIQFRDVIADGLLDGLEISESTGAVTPLTFGQQRITSDVYTQDLSQHVLIVVNDPELNISGTDADDYVAFSQKINDLGSHGETDGVIPPRDETEIDTVPPTITRTDNDVLTKTDNVDIRLNDDIGVQSVSAYVQYQLNGVWSDEFKCNDQQTSGSEFCTVDASGFEVGVRETNIKVSVDTKAIDAVEVDSDTGLSNVTAARLVFYTADVLGNELIPGSNSGHYVNFEWDNDAPVISVTSASAINNELQEYVLKGIVKEASQDIKSVSVSFKSGLPEDVACTPVTAESGSACEFSKAYSTDEFLSTTTFDVRATDTKDNVGEYQHAVSRDDQAPAQIITYPEGTSMNYVNVTVDGERSTYEGVYTQDTYTSDNVQSSRDYLKIDYVYAASGLKSIQGVDFANFHVNVLKENKIPYVRVRVADVNSDTVLGSSADKLKLVVKYYVSQNNDNNYAFQNTTQTVASTDTITASIPHETILDSEGRVDEVIYYVPFVKEVLGDGFKNVSENASQKLVIQTIDESDNESATQEVYFRSSFDLPTMTVVTPFIGARVQLEGLNPNGEFTSLASCTTIQQPESDQTTALDVASCETTTDVVNYEFMRVRLIGVEGTDPHYYQWKDDAGAKASVNLNNANIGAYFELDGSNTYYVTELATYQTGLFDYRWNQVEAGDKTSERASQILTEVKYALAGGNESFFGFDPTITAYATNEMLEETIPSDLSNDYLHRFLVEAIDDLSQDTPRNNSSDFASAIYDDLSYDGKANGIGAGGNQIQLDGYVFKPDTYRKDLAQSYYNIMTEKYGIPDNIAQLYADDISTANPKLGEDNIFDSGGGSIDIYPPKQTLTIETGRETMVGDKLYVAGEVVSRVVLEDPSGVVEEGEQAPKFQSMWYAMGDPNTAIPLELQPQESGDSNKFRKEYFFTLNTESTDLTDIIEFALETTAFDTKGNGYTEAEPHVESLYVDNDYPKASYIPPKDTDNQPIGEDVYLNANSVHELTFKVDDVVGDQLDKRSLSFVNYSNNATVEYSSEQFASNQQDAFVVKLCTGVLCESQGKVIYPGDGNWKVNVNAEDNLGNLVNQQTVNVPKFDILIDSEAPAVNGGVIDQRLGGNSAWVPDIDAGDLSPLSEVQVDMKTQFGKRFTLQHYETEPVESEEPYLFGTQPNVEVRLVADAFKYEETNTFYVKAIDSAYPKAEATGEFIFQVDNKGPEIELATPWVVDSNSGKSGVLGPNFKVSLTSVKDDSKVSNVEIWQVGSSEAIRSIEPKDPSQPFDIEINSTQSGNITIDENNRADLFVKAIDEYGFYSDTEARSIILDREGPNLQLNGVKPESYYRGDYVFTLYAQDLNETGAPSTEGVNKDTLKFNSFIDTPSDPDTQVEEDMKVNLGGQNDGDSSTRTIRLSGADVRGNTTEIDYEIKVQNKLPTINSVSFSYEDGTEITNGLITRNDPVIITIDAEDASGIPKIEATYKFGDTTNSIQFSEEESGKWKGRLTSAELSNDGSYELKFKVYNNVLYNTGDRPVTERSETINVQREGVVLSVAQPENFQAHISGKTLSVVFNPVGDVKAKTLECWVRENYTSTEVPDDGSSNAYSGVISNPQENYKCDVTTDVNMSVNPVVLITRTVGQNDTETVSKFSFSMMDIEAPTAQEDTYQLDSNNVGFDADGNKILSITLNFRDNLSGVNTELTKRPVLVRSKFNLTFEPKSCSTSADLTTCTYTELYSDIIASGISKHLYTIKNLSDRAGNAAPDHALELLLPPPGSVQIAITNPENDSIIRGSELSMDFKVKVGNNSILENLIATVDGQSYSLKDNPDNFSRFNDCGDDYSCSTFKAPLSDTLDGQVISPSIQALDVWEDSSSAKVDVMVDNSKPIIDSDVTVSESPTDPSLVRFLFSIRDEGSGIATVKYTTTNPSHVFNKEAGVDNSHLYFELPKTELEGLSQLRVSIQATDKVGWSENQTLDIDLTAPTITLSFNDMASLLGGKLAFTKESQSFTITSTEGEHVKATHYSIDMVLTTGDPLNFNGNIVSSSATGTMDFAIDDQAEYMYKVTVTDSMGRAITDFKLFNNAYNAEGIASVVDYELPVITGITADQVSMKPTDDKYKLDVTADVTDKNLSSVTSTADNGSGSAVGPQSITEPTNDGDPYVFHYLLSPGDYTIKVIATDAVSNQTEKTTTYKVEAATVPELTISTTASTPLAGGVDVPLTFTFTEEVTEFDISDVKLDENNGGELKPLSWSTTDNITWTVTYITPERENKDITIGVDDESYKSINTIPGKGDSLVLGVEGVLPTLTKVTFDPLHQEIGKAVDVKLEFDKELQEATATLGTNNVTSLTADPADKKVWTGTVNVPDVPELGVGLVVSQYKDLVGNVGEDNTSYELPITPILAITPVGNVDGNNAASLQIAGTSTRFEGQTVNVEIKAQGSETPIVSSNATVQSGGAWTSNAMDISGEPNGTYNVVVTGTNASNVEVTETSTLTLSQALPTLTSATFNPTHQLEGQNVTVTLEFDKALQAASAELGGSAFTLTKTADAKVWTGDVVVPVTSELTVGLVVKDYQDLSGNTGADDSSHSMPITPILAITPVGNVDGSNAASLQIAGTSTRFDGQTVNVEIKAQGSETAIVSSNATVQSGGAWTSNAMDISGEPNGTYNVVVTGTNASNVEVTETSTLTLSQALPTLTSATFNPTHQLEGQNVTVTLEFDKALQAASAELGGSAITLTKTADAKVWTGDVVVPVTSGLTVGLVVKDYQDLSGNTGADDSSHSMPITPTLVITPAGNVDGTNAASLQIAGTSTRFDGQTVNVEIKAQGSETAIVSSNATVQSGGAWTSNAMDISGEPNGTYNVVVTGTNASNVEVTETSTLTLSQALPTLTSATFNPTHQLEGQNVTVTLEFDKALQAASAELGGSAITLTKTADAKVWTGDVVVPVTSGLTVGLVVKDYQDLSGNTGADDSSHSMPITPTLEITPAGNVDGTNAASLQITGTSTRFDGQTVSVEIKAQGSETPIVSSNATVQSGGAWTSNAMDISGEPNGTYNVVVTGTNASNVEVTETSTLTLSQALPTLTSATFNPTHQLEGQNVTVTLEFDKALQAASAELGGSAFTLTKTADAKVWTGDVVVPVTSELTVGLVVKDYQDLSGNTGADDSSHSMPITPILAITPVGNVDGNNAASLQIAGTSTRFEGQTVNVEIKAQGSETAIVSSNATVQSGGAWTSNAMDISGESNGTYNVVVTGTNASNVEVTETSTLTLSQALPTLTSATFNPTHQLEGQNVTVTLEFDKALQAASAELGGSAFTLTKTADAKVWTGDVVVPVTSELTVGLVVKDYQDLSGNTGADDSSHSMPITPILVITPVGNVDGSNAASLQIAGTSTRFEGQTVNVEIKAQGSETPIVSSNATVQSGGAWTSNAMDISGEPNGTYNVVVTGTNASNVEVTETSTLTLSQALPTLTSATFNPTHQLEGQNVTVTLEFDKALQAASAELGGSAFTLTKTADAKVWTGDVVVPVTSGVSVGLVVKDYQDLSGNTGADDSSHSMPITPTITIGTISDVSGSTTVTINGTTTRFEAGDSIALKAVDTDSLEVIGSATVLVDGTWTVDLDLSTLKDGEITVYANGTNSLSAIADEMSTTFNYSSTTALVVPNYWERYSAELPSLKAA
ncbi:tandem large repeat [Vibrio campbellii]|uniref:tandem large repeat n=1 Tax=Vibrio campbellii TaxID=680 RepID=UPI003AAC9508